MGREFVPDNSGSWSRLSKRPAEVERSAILSPCRKYRYVLQRRWGEGPACMFIGLNPSTADETHDDHTITRCIGFARGWGYDALCMMNLFAFRSTDPRYLYWIADPVGPENNMMLARHCREAGIVVAAWGNKGVYMQRDAFVRRLIPTLYYLRLTNEGQPNHPLYLPLTMRPVLWRST